MSEPEIENGVGAYPAGFDPTLFHLVGTIVAGWGRIEGCLVNDLHNMRQHPAASAYVAKEDFPLASKRKVKQWAKLRNLILPAGHERKTTEVKDRMLAALNERNDIVHFTWPIETDHPSCATLRYIGPPKEGLKGKPQSILQRHKRVSIESLDKTSWEMVLLLKEISDEGRSALNWMIENLKDQMGDSKDDTSD